MIKLSGFNFKRLFAPAQPEHWREDMLDVVPVPGSRSYKMAIYHWGDTNNPRKALCVHGLSRTGRDFEDVAQELCKTHHVIAPDMPGRGQSEWFEDPDYYNYPFYMNILYQLITHLGVEKLDMVGTSMGGMLAMFMGATTPPIFNKVVMNDVGAIIPLDAIEMIGKYLGRLEHHETKEDAMKFIKVTYADMWGLKDDVALEKMFAHTFRLDPAGYIQNFDAAIVGQMMKNVEGVDEDLTLMPLWKALPNDVLLIHGEKSPLLTDPIIEEMRKERPIQAYLRVEGVAHAPALMDFEQVKAIADFLNE